MPAISIDQLADVVAPQSEAELARSIGGLANSLEFDHFVVGVQVTQAFAPAKQHITNGYPSRWRKRYDENNYIVVDPTVRHCVTQTGPLVWSKGVFAKKARPMWEEAKACGLSHGISIPARTRSGTVSMLSLARDKALDTSEARHSEVMRCATLVAYCAHVATEKLIVPELLKSMAPRLTRREREALKWAAAGKSAWEIAHILNISERTAVFHLTNLVKKLGVTNRTQAVVAGLSLGLV